MTQDYSISLLSLRAGLKRTPASSDQGSRESCRYTLKTTGKGLPEGPGGVYGALEGVSYLMVLGLIGWSIATKVKTGSGLPSGPGGALGAVEGLSYLSLLGAVAVFGLTFLERGSLPGPLG